MSCMFLKVGADKFLLGVGVLYTLSSKTTNAGGQE